MKYVGLNGTRDIISSKQFVCLKLSQDISFIDTDKKIPTGDRIGLTVELSCFQVILLVF